MGDQYCLLGPYKEACARTEVEEGPLGCPALNDAVNAVRNKGYKVLYRLKTFLLLQHIFS